MCIDTDILQPGKHASARLALTRLLLEEGASCPGVIQLSTGQHFSGGGA